MTAARIWEGMVMTGVWAWPLTDQGRCVGGTEKLFAARFVSWLTRAASK
jgi:hypothetical protein